MQLWISDPKTKEPSVSLSMLCVSFVAALVAMGLHMAKVIDDTSVATELLYSTTALYFGRRFSIKGNDYNSEKTEGSKE